MEEKRQKIKEEAYSLIADSLGIDAGSVSEESAINELSDDSIKLFELLLAFEKKYQIETVYQDIVSLITVRDIIEYLMKRLYDV